jgi:hypothetical protein
MNSDSRIGTGRTSATSAATPAQDTRCSRRQVLLGVRALFVIEEHRFIGVGHRRDVRYFGRG